MSVREPVVVGHSWGMLVAVALGLRADYPVGGLVLASGYYFPNWRLDFWLLLYPSLATSALHRRTHHLACHPTGDAPQVLRATSRATAVQDGVSNLARASSQTVEEGGGGKWVPYPGGDATAISVH